VVKEWMKGKENGRGTVEGEMKAWVEDY